MNLTPTFPVERLRSLVAHRRLYRLEDAQQPVRGINRRRFVVDLVLEIEADRLPLDVEIALWCNSIDDPTGRHPTPWSYGIDVEVDLHLDRTPS